MPGCSERTGRSADASSPNDAWVGTSAKKSAPLSLMTTKAGKFSTSMRQTASVPRSGWSRTSTRRIDSVARRVAGAGSAVR